MTETFRDPVQPASRVSGAALGLPWPVPMLDVPQKFLGMRKEQALYVFGAIGALFFPNYVVQMAYDLRGVVLAVPFWVWLLWSLPCVTAGVVGFFVTWHKRHPWAAIRLVLRDKAEPAVSVWRPVP